MHDTRLGIPVLFHEESLHGYMATDATMFPQAIALAGSFDTQLMQDVQSVVAREVRARGVPFVLSPVVDIVRDPRWGRIEETFGEDPFLAAEMGVAAVEGLQGPGKFEQLAPGKVYATLKHMTGHGQPESGENVGPAPIAERELRENFFPPFREVVRRTSIGAVMPSYNEIDGIPSHANQWLLRKVLRGEWGFDGLIASDYSAVDELATLHHVVDDMEGAARAALAAGVDSELPNGQAYRTLVAQVRAGKVSEKFIDEACARMLRLKFRAGLFENPYGDFALADRLTGNAEARALALRAAQRSICLLKNDGTLPLTAGAHRRVAVIGPNAAIARLGGYSSVPRQAVSLLDGIRARLAGKAEVLFAQGVYITHNDDRSVDEIILADPTRNRTLIAEAVEVARSADVVVLAIGDTEQTSREGFARNHLGDRTSLDLVGEQTELFNALQALGKPVVVCAINGRPPSWPDVAARANAILECWYAGQEGGTAMAEALFGDINPGAKLPVTVVRDAGQIPSFYNHKSTARRGYLFADKAPLFPFGFGLSYTTFELSAPTLSANRIAAGDALTVNVTVRNTGARAGDEVVQVYIRRVDASVTQPVLELKGFQRITLQPGEVRKVALLLAPQTFALWNAEMREVIEPGKVDILAGPNSRHLKAAQLVIA
jgi:beta-glucosidase